MIDAYLNRLGLDREPPSAEALFRLHRAHVERVPYETLWIHLGEQWGVDLAGSVRRIATEDRGGYCFHLNGAFSELLTALGYQVSRHVGGVHGVDGPSADELTNHLVLTAEGLPTEENPEGIWYLDVGLGDALHEPLPLRAGLYRQGPFQISLEATPGDVGDWHLTHDPAGGFGGMAWKAATATIDEFAQRHEWLSTSPESGFVKVLTIQKRDATGVTVLRGLTLRRIGESANESEIGSESELIQVVSDTFGIALGDVDAERRARLWSALRTSHEAWKAEA